MTTHSPTPPEWVEADLDGTRMYVLMLDVLKNTWTPLDPDTELTLSLELMELIEHYTHPNLTRLRKETS
jgi:hypothetical protein